MFRKTVEWHTLLLLTLVSATLLGQQKPEAASASQGTEFPVIMRANVAAGKTPVGTKVEAKLIVATLVNGVVVPRDATLSGEVTESVAKSATEPSRLAVRMDAAKWKDKSAPIKLYLTAWYYPVATMTPQDLSYQPPDAARAAQKTGTGPVPTQTQTTRLRNRSPAAIRTRTLAPRRPRRPRPFRNIAS